METRELEDKKEIIETKASEEIDPNKQIIITPDAELFMGFNIGEKKNGVEKVYLEDTPITKPILLDKLNRERKIKLEAKKKIYDKPYYEYNPPEEDVLTQWYFDIRDDIGEINTKSARKNIIGTTLVNFLNKLDKIIPILNRYILKFKDLDTENQELFDYIKELEHVLILQLNLPLTFLVKGVFKTFYKDYEYIMSHKDEIYSFQTISEDNLKRKPYNTYYKQVYKYMVDISSADTCKRYEKFNIKDVAQKFLNSIQQDICNMLNNYDLELKYEYIRVDIADDMAKSTVTSLNELFYYSKYHIEKDGRELKCCDLCGRFFVTDYRNTETHCRRLYDRNSQKNCCDEANLNSKRGYGYSKLIDNELAKIKLQLLIRDCQNNTFEMVAFYKELCKRAKYRLDTELNKKEIIKYDNELLSWLKSKTEQLKDNTN